MGRKPDPRLSPFSRREFGKRAALVAGAGFAGTADVPGRADGRRAGGPRDLLEQSAPPLPELSPEGRVRFETMWQSVLRTHGERLNDEQKTRLRKIVANNALMLESVYAVPLKNGDAPATSLRLVESKTTPPGSRGAAR